MDLKLQSSDDITILNFPFLLWIYNLPDDTDMIQFTSESVEFPMDQQIYNLPNKTIGGSMELQFTWLCSRKTHPWPISKAKQTERERVQAITRRGYSAHYSTRYDTPSYNKGKELWAPVKITWKNTV